VVWVTGLIMGWYFVTFVGKRVGPLIDFGKEGRKEGSRVGQLIDYKKEGRE
jgi:hypothetical protein